MKRRTERLTVDVRTREEYVKEHIKGAINIPLYDLEFYVEFLKDKKVNIYCNSGKRTRIALEKLRKLGIEAEPLHNPDSYEREGKKIICAVNYIEVRPGAEEKFEGLARYLCSEAENLGGFLGSKFMKVSGISGKGSGLEGKLEELNIPPTKYLFITYWETKQHYEKSHTHPVFTDAFKKILKLLAKPPFEEFFDIIR